MGDHLNDDGIIEMMHSTFINKKTSSNESFNFEEFYTVVIAYNNKWESSYWLFLTLFWLDLFINIISQFVTLINYFGLSFLYLRILFF